MSLLFFNSTAKAATLTVTKTADTDDGTCDADCSLREAMTSAVASDIIIFNTTTFSTGSPVTITVSSGLPAMSVGSVTLDASNAGVILDGGGTVADGLSITSSNNVVRGLRIQNFTNAAINITSGTGIIIGGNNTTGSGPSGEGNVLVLNGAGVDYTGSGVTITGNYVGTDQNSTGSLGNTVVGLWIHANGATVGGSSAGLGNVVSGNADLGIQVGEWGAGAAINTAAVIIGNYIGTNVTGTAALANGNQGIAFFRATNNVLGGTASGEGNVISGNATVGIDAQFLSSTTAEGNYVGTRADGTGSIPNGGGGIRIFNASATLTLGMSSSFRPNKIGANTGDGILLSDGTLNWVNTLDADDNINLTGGSLNMGSATVNLASDWTNGGATITAGTSTLNLDGTNQILTGSTTFYNLNKTVTNAATLTFAANSTQTIATGGSLTLKGASGQLLSLDSSSSPTRWNLSVPAAVTKDVQFVRVSDADATDGDITALDATSVSNNDDGESSPQWVFVTTDPYTWTGAINSDWNNAGNWFGNNAPGSSNTAIFSPLYTVNANINAAVSVSGIQIDSGYSATITQQTGNTVTMGTGGYVQAGGTFTGGDSLIDINNGSFILSGGSFTNSSGNLNIERDLTVSGGTYNNSGRIVLVGGNASDDSIVSCSGVLGGVLDFNKTHNLADVMVVSGCSISLGADPNTQLSSTLTNNGTITIASGTWTETSSGIYVNNGTITHSGSGWDSSGSLNNTVGRTITYSGTALSFERNFTQSGTFDLGDKTLTLDGGNAGDDSTVTCSGSLGGVLDFNKNSSSADVTIASGCGVALGANPNTRIDSTLTNNGTITIVSGTWTETGSGSYVNNGTITHSGSGWDSDSSLNNTGTGTIIYAGSTLFFERNFTHNGTFDLSGKTLILDGNDASSDSTLICGLVFAGNITLNKTNNSADFTLGSNCTIQGNFTRTNGLIINPATAYTLSVEGNVDISSTDLSGGANFTLELSGSGPQTLALNAGDFDSKLNIKKTGNTAQLTTAFTTAGASSTCDIVEGTFDLNAQAFTCASTFTVQNGGNLQLQGVETPTTPTLNTGSSVTYNGTSGTGQLLTAGNTYYNLIFNGVGGVWDQAAPLDVNGNLTITNGTLDSASNNLNIAGNWLNSGTYTSGANTVTLDGTGTQSITSGGSSFNNLTITNASNVVTFADALSTTNFTAITPSTQLRFAASLSHSVSGTLDINGQASGTLIVLDSTSSGTQFLLNVGSAQEVNFVSVKDSDATGFDITARDGINAGGNDSGTPQWVFVTTDPYTWTGAINSDWNNNGNWFGNNAPGTSDTAIFSALYTVNANINVPVDVSGVQIDSGYSATLTQEAGNTLEMGGGGYTQAGGIFVGGDSLIDIVNGSFVLSGGTFTNSSGNLNIERNFTVSGGTYDNSGRIVFDGGNGNDDSILSCSGTLGGTVGFNKTVLTAEVIIDNACSIELGADPVTRIDSILTNNGTITITSGTWTETGVGGITVNNGTITHSGSGWDSRGSLNNAVGGTITMSGTALSFERDFTQLGTFNLTGKILTLDGNNTTDDSTVICSGELGGSLDFNKNNVDADITITSGCRVELGADPNTLIRGTLTNNGTITIVSGIWTETGEGGIVVNNGTITHSGSGWDSSGSLNNPVGGTITMIGTALSFERDFTQLGTFNLMGKILTLDGNNTPDDSTVVCSGALGGTLDFNKNNEGADITILIGCSVDLGADPNTLVRGTLTNNGTITIESGIWTETSINGIYFNNGTITHGGSGWDSSGSLNNAVGGTITYTGTTLSFERNFTQVGTFDLTGKTLTLDSSGSSDDATLVCGGVIEGNVILNKASDGGDFTLGSNCTIQGNFTRTNGLIINPATAYTLSVEGNVDISSTDLSGGANFTLELSGNDPQTLALNAGDFDSKLNINKTGNAALLTSAFTTAGASSTCDIVEGTFDLNAQAFTCASTFTVQNGGNLQLQGVETPTAPTLNTGSSVTYNGNGTYPGLVIGDVYANLIFNNAAGTWTLDNALDVNGNLSISNGTLDVNGTGNYQINVAGNWSNSGTLTARSGTVVFDGTNQTITGSTTFNNFTKIESTNDSSDVTLTFGNTATQTISGLLTLDGLDADDRILLVSDSLGTQWGLTANGTFAIDNVRPTDSDASGGTTIVHTSTTNGGNNLNWGFPPVISGTLYTDDDELTPLTSKLVRLLINGIDSGLTATTDATTGAYTINATTNVGDTLLIFLDNEAEDGTTVTVSSGGSISGLNIYQNHVNTRHDNGGALTNANMDTATNGDPDIQYSVSGGNLTVSGTGTELYIPASHSFTPGGDVVTPAMENLGTFAGGSGFIDVNGLLTLTSGSFTATSGNTNITGDYTYTSGTVTPNGGTFVFGDPGSGSTITGSHSLNNVTFDSGRTSAEIWNIAAGTTLTVTGTLTLDNSSTGQTSLSNTGVIAAQGNVILGAESFDGTATLRFSGGATQTLTGSGGLLPDNVVVAKSGNELLLSGSFSVQNWTLANVGGSFNAGSSTVTFRNNDSGAQIQGSHTLNNVILGHGSGSTRTWTVSDGTTLTIIGNLSLSNTGSGASIINTTSTGTIAAQNNVTVSSSSSGPFSGTVNFQLTGGNTQIFDLSGAEAFFDLDVLVNKSGNAVNLASTLTMDASNQDLDIQVGIFDLNGNNLTVNGTGSTFTVQSGGTFQLQGGETTTVPALNIGSSVFYDGGGTYTGLAAGNTYSNLSFNNAGGTWTLGAALDVNNNLTMTNGTLDVSVTDYPINVAGNWDNSGTLTARSGTVLFDGTNQSIIGSTTFNNFSKTESTNDATDVTLTFDNTATQTINGSFTLDALDDNDRINLVSDSPGNQWSLVLTAGVTKTLNYVDVQDSDASGSSSALIPVDPVNALNSGNNIQWFSGVTGTVFTDATESTTLSGLLIRLLVDGVSVGTATTNGSGVYSIVASPTAGQTLLVYIDNETQDGSMVTVSDGGTLSNLNIHQNHVSLRHENGGAMSNSILAAATNGDADIQYTVSGADLTITGGQALHLRLGHSFTPGGAVTGNSMDINGSLSAGANTLTVAGNLDLTGGSLSSTGTVIFDGISDQSLTSAGSAFNHLTLNNSGSAGSDNLIIVGALDINGNLTLTDGDLDIATNNITVNTAGNVSIGTNGSIDVTGRTANWTFDGMSNLSDSSSAGPQDLEDVVVNGTSLTLGNASKVQTLTVTSGILNLGSAGYILEIDGTGTPFSNSGTFTAGTSTVNYSGSGANTTLATLSYDNLSLSPSSATTYLLAGSLSAANALSGNMTLNANATLDVTASNYDLVLGGNWTNSGSFTARAGTVTFSGTTDQNIISGGLAFYDLILNNTGSAGSDSLVIVDALDIDGNLTLTEGDLDIAANNVIVNTAGNVSIGTNGSIDVTGRTANWTFDGTTILSDSSSSGPQDLQDVVVNGTSLTLGSASKVQTLTVTSGILNLGSAGYVLEIDGTGTPLSNSGTFTAGTSTVRYSGSGTATNIATLAYSSLSLSPSSATNYSLLAALSGANALSGSLTISSNASFNSAGFDLDVGGNWTNAGTYTSGSNTVLLNGTGTQAITSGGSAFNNLTLINASNVVTFSDALSTGNFTAITPSTQLTFAGGTTNTISGSLNLNGQATGTRILLRSTNTSQYILDVTGAPQTVSYVDVQYSDAGTNDITANTSTNSGNNDDAAASPHWIFSVQITGMVYTDEGITPIADGATVRLLVNGFSVGTDTTTSGAYAISSGPLNANDAMLVYIDNHVSDGTTVTVSDGFAFSGLDIYASRVITRHDNGGSLNNANMSMALGGFSDAEILYSVTGGNLTISGTGTELYIPASHSFAPAGNVTTPAMENLGAFDGGSGTIDVNGALQLTSGVFTATTGLTAIGTDFTISGGAFAHNSGTIRFDLASATINIGSARLNDLELVMGTGTLTVTGAVDVNGDFTLSNAGSISGGTITLAGNLVGSDSSVDGTTAITLDGTGVQDLNVTGDLPDSIFTINKGSGSVVLSANFTTALDGVGQDMTLNQGTIDLNGFSLTVPDVFTVNSAGILQLEGGETLTTTTTNLNTGSTVRYDGGGSYSALSAGNAYSNLIFNNAGGNWTQNTALDVNRHLTLTAGTLNSAGNTINIAGNWINNGNYVSGTNTVIFDGGNQSLTGSNTFNHFTKTDSTNDATDLTLTFDNTATQTINGLFRINGLDADDRVNLLSDSPGNQWSLVLGASASKVVNFVDVQDSNASGSDAGLIPVSPTNSVDSGNNLQWFATAVAATSTLAEMTANLVSISSTGNAFIYDLLPTISGSDTGIDQVVVTAPSAYVNLSVSAVSVGGSVQTAGALCPTVGAGEYCVFVASQTLTVMLGTKVTTTLTNIRIAFNADAPSTVGSADFTSTIDDTGTGIAAQNTTVGNADGDAVDNNSITVQVVGRAMTSTLAEISPNVVPVNTFARTYVYDLLPTISVGDTGINEIILTAPAGHTNLSLSAVSLGGTALVSGVSCASPGAQYCVSIAGQVMTVTLVTPVTTSLIPIRLTLSSDAPTTVGSADFTASLDDTTTMTSAQAATVGNADGDVADANSITVATGDLAASAALAEISPTTVVMGSVAEVFTLDLLPTINTADTGIDQLELTVPTSYANLNVSRLSVGGTNQVLGASCPSLVAGEYCSSVSGEVMTLTLGSKVMASLTNVQVQFRADVPASAGTVSFTAKFNDTSTATVVAQSATAGDADGDAADANSLSITVQSIDRSASLVSASPSLIEIDRDGDGNPYSTITVIPKDSSGLDLGSGLNVTISVVEAAPTLLSAKLSVERQAPGDPFGALSTVMDNGDGTYSVQISSSASGIASVSARVNAVQLQSSSTVTFTAGEVLKIIKTANKKSGVIGDVVTYEVVVQNTTTVAVSSVTLNDKIPPGFKYLRGSTLVNGQPGSDPTGNQTRAFSLGTIAAWIDQNGNGSADAGDLGNITLSYQLVIGSGVKPGEHVNRAQAVDFSVISNEASAKIRVDADPIFDLSTLIGKVFFDKNKNGYQDRGEAGIPGARVVLDNGTYVMTDDHGRYHFPGVQPGQRLLKINTATLPPGTTVTTEEARIVEVSRGLLTKVNFGVIYDTETVHIGRVGKQGIGLAAQTQIEDTQVTAYLESMKLLVNGDGVRLPLNQTFLGVGALEETVEIIGEDLSRAIPFSITMDTPDRVKAWRLEIVDAEGEIFGLLQGKNAPPKEILWDGKDAAKNLMEGGAVYSYQFKIDYKDGSSESSARRIFGVNKTSAISLNLLGSAFAVGSAEINAKTEEALHELAETLKKYPNEKITIEGHTDNTGSEISNLELSKARAEAAMNYLLEKEGISKNRFEIEWFGEGKPIANNRFAEGRTVNRRVEIVGAIQEVKKAKIFNHPRSDAVMTINGVPMKTDAGDRFSISLAQDVSGFDFEMSSPQGEVIKKKLLFPTLEITAPAQNEMMVVGKRNKRYLALPRPKDGQYTTGLPVASYRLKGLTEEGNQLWVDGKRVKLAQNGVFETDILLNIGENIFTLVASNLQNVSRMMTLKIDLSDTDEAGRVLMAVKPIPQISVLLPPKDKVLSHTALPLRGMTDPRNEVWVNQEKVMTQKNGTFSTKVQLEQGKNTVRIEVRDPEGFVSQIEREVFVENEPFFLMVLADGEFGQISTSGYLEGAGAGKGRDYYAKGRLAYYLKGKILGKYLMTSAFDTGKNEFDQMFKDLDKKETERFFTNIDPDKFYPVYGDESTVVYDAQTQGKFYLAIEGEDLNVLVGNYKTGFNETELATFNRTLYGGRFEYRSLSKSPYGAHDTKVVVFVAQVRQAHAQNTFRATGGSLYYLSEKEIIEGSEQVRLEVRDQQTGLVLAQIDQVRDADYSFKYEEGRILFRRPISSVVSNDLLLRQESLQGHPVFVLVDFEYEAQGFDKKSVGARVRQQLGPHLAVGGTAIEDAAESGDYKLAALDAKVRFGKGTTLVGEYAESKGTNSTTLISDDGGLSFTSIASAAVGRGEAYKVAIRSDISEWFGEKNRLVSNVYYKRLSPGFFSNGTLLEQGTLKYGGGIKAILSKRDVLRFRYDFQEVIANGNLASANQVGAKQVIMKEVEYDHRRGPFLFTAGFQDKQINDITGLSKIEQQLAGRVDWKMSERISSSIRHQQQIKGKNAYRTTLGLKAGFTPWLDGVAEGSTARDRDTALLGLSARLDERSTVYANETLDKKQGQDATWGSVVGGDRMLTQGLKLYGEYGQARGNVNQTRSLWGLDQRLGDNKKLKISLNYERSYLKGITQNTTRDSASVRLRYQRPDGSRLAHRIEVRLEKGADRKIQRLTTHRGELKIFSGLTLFGKFNFSDTKNKSQNRLEARFTEAGAGVAYRPTAFDRLNLITKYTFILDEKPNASGPMLKTSAHVSSLEAIYDLSRHFQWVQKYAVKIKEERQSPRADLKSQTDLWINRLNFHVNKSWDIGVEYRILKQSLAKDQLEGYAVEVNRAIAKHFRLGVGYNFSRFSDNEFSDNNYDARGWFIRAQGKY